MNIDDFKKAKITFMKEGNKDAVSALNLVINKTMLASIEKKAQNQELGDADVVAILQKSVKELEEEREAFAKANRTENVASLDNQINAVKGFLPTLMSEDEIKNIIEGLDDKSIPSVMKHFKTNYAGKVDMGLVNKLARG